MKKHKKLIVISVLSAFLISLVVLYLTGGPGRFTDACTNYDRMTKNCVPAGRCTPPGDPKEAVIECEIKNYDHKFHQ